MSSEAEVSRAIIGSYTSRFLGHLQSDAIIVGAGPSGLVCAWRLAQEGLKVTILEKRLAPGGGIWGGGMGMPDLVVEKTTSPLLEELNVQCQEAGNGLLVASAAELAAGLVLAALRSGAALFNLTYLEDLVVKEGRVTGVVANRTFLGDNLPIDPITFDARAVADTTGHEFVAAQLLAKRGLLKGEHTGEGPMDAEAAEAFVVKKTGACFPGLYLAGMSVCSFYGGPRMGPIFGGMLLSGEKAAKIILKDLRKRH
ncbi:MAG: thiazole biosynthesis protein [Acidobacteria bacterium]|jgi:thiamine thiazole synthase|nr:thiazole biosynthesis protein [Acidobacteriota bacterium]